jgi:hypothetical protein
LRHIAILTGVGLARGSRSCQITTVLTTTLTTVAPSDTSATAPESTYRAWSRLLPAPGSVGVRGSSPLSSTSGRSFREYRSSPGVLNCRFDDGSDDNCSSNIAIAFESVDRGSANIALSKPIGSSNLAQSARAVLCWLSDHELVGWLSASNNDGPGSWAITRPHLGAGPAGLVPGILGVAEPITISTW